MKKYTNYKFVIVNLNNYYTKNQETIKYEDSNSPQMQKKQ